MRATTLGGFALWLSSLAHAQTQLVKVNPSARGGTVTIGSTASGLSVRIAVDGAAPRWTRAGDLRRGDRVEISIADVAPVVLPPIGWGHQFGYELLSREEDCFTREFDTTAAGRRTCVDWFRRQAPYRAQFVRLFARRWVVTPSIVRETYARPAFASLDSIADVDLLAPTGTPRARVVPAAQGYSLEVSIPWDALPPLQSTQLTALRVLVDAYAGNARSTTDSSANRGDPSSFPRVALTSPRSYGVTPCKADFVRPIIQGDASRDFLNASDSARVFFRPTTSLDIRRAIVVDAPARGYQYEPDSSLRSPVVGAMKFWTVSLGKGEVLCGPYLAYRRGNDVKRSGISVDLPSFVTSKRLANGDVLVKNGPRVFSSYFGSGQCGGCPRVMLEIFHLSKTTGEITRAFSFLGIAESEVTDIDAVVAADWSEITIFEGKIDSTPDPPRTRWNSTTHCFRAATNTYEECRHATNVRPPSPRRVNPHKE